MPITRFVDAGAGTLVTGFEATADVTTNITATGVLGTRNATAGVTQGSNSADVTFFPGFAFAKWAYLIPAAPANWSASGVFAMDVTNPGSSIVNLNLEFGDATYTGSPVKKN